MNIRQIVLRNFGPFTGETIPFDIVPGEPNIHIFAGSNGTGKTSILHALASAFDYFEQGHKEHISNNIHKRFVRTGKNKKFEKDTSDNPASYIHISLTDSKDGFFEKIVNHGCEKCDNIHQNINEENIDYTSIEEGRFNTNLNAELAIYKNALLSKDINQYSFKFAAFGYSGYRFIESEEVQITNADTLNPLNLALEFVKKKDGSEKQFNISNWIVSRYSKAALEEVAGNKEASDNYRFAINKLITCINSLTNNEFQIKVETNPLNVRTEFCGNNLEFDVLPDGLRSILSWLGDLLMRLDALPWEDKSIPVTEQKIFLFLDEIEVHLHPTWQYKILGILNELLPNAQIFISTHSPFIINSIDNAKLYILENTDCKSCLSKTIKTQTGWSIQYVLRYILNAKANFGAETETNLLRFDELNKEILKGDFSNEIQYIEIIKNLKNDGEEVFYSIAPLIFNTEESSGKKYI
jgi:predicted ATP-binding protein involved in virulence